MEIVYDDRTKERNLSANALTLLIGAYGRGHMYSLSHLMADHPSSADDMQYSSPAARPQHQAAGRRLFERGVEHMATHAKLWLWALPRHRSVILDSDMVVRGALDWLTTYPLKEHEVAAAGVVRRGALSFFNSGLLVIQPGAQVLRNLTRAARMARSGTIVDGHGAEQPVAKVGEKIFGDQSLLNVYFKDSWRPLPTATAAVAPSRVTVDASRVIGSDPAVVHWLSEPKPWCRPALRLEPRTRQPVASLSGQAKLWWDLCEDKVTDVPARMLG